MGLERLIPTFEPPLRGTRLSSFRLRHVVARKVDALTHEMALLALLALLLAVSGLLGGPGVCRRGLQAL
jgi:hypothetical protein